VRRLGTALTISLGSAPATRLTVALTGSPAAFGAGPDQRRAGAVRVAVTVTDAAGNSTTLAPDIAVR
jgi:hypothetical protein